MRTVTLSLDCLLLRGATDNSRLEAMSMTAAACCEVENQGGWKFLGGTSSLGRGSCPFLDIEFSPVL